MEARIAKVEGNNPTSSTFLSAASQRKRPETSLPDGIAEAIRQKVATRKSKLGLQESESSNQNEETDTVEEQDNIPTPLKDSKGKRRIKSGRARNANSSIKYKFRWPHEVVYNKDGSPAEFDTLSVPQFIRGYTMDHQQYLTHCLYHNSSVVSPI